MTKSQMIFYNIFSEFHKLSKSETRENIKQPIAAHIPFHFSLSLPTSQLLDLQAWNKMQSICFRNDH